MDQKLSDEQVIRYYLPGQARLCYETLYYRHVDKVYQQCLSMAQNVEQAQDLTQDVFLKVFHKLDAFQHRSRFSTWLYAITYNHCADHLRLSRRLLILPIDTVAENELPEADQRSWHEEALQQVGWALERLSPVERHLLALKYEHSLSLKQIAHLYDLRLSAVKMRLKRSLEKLQRLGGQS